MDLLQMFIVLEPFGHFVVSEVVQEVQLLKILTDPKQQKSVTIKLSHKTLFNKGYTLTPVFKRQMNASVACRIKANFKCSMRNFEVIQPARRACTFW